MLRVSGWMCTHDRSSACGLDGRTGQLFERRLTPDHGDIESWIRSLPGPVTVTYEAGPTGFRAGPVPDRAGHRVPGRGAVEVAAPVWGSGQDRRCAMPGIWPGCCIWTRSSRLTVPGVEQEAARDLVRARDAVRGDLMRARHRLSKLLLRHGIVYYGGRPWTGSHDLWLRAQRRGALFTTPGLGLAFDTAYDTVLATLARRDRLDAAITAMAAASAFTPVVCRLGCLRGVATLTAFGLAVEIGDWHRLTGSSIGAYLGLVPTESSSGDSRSRGSITKTGNGHARRLLIEAAWHHRPPYRTERELRRRQDAASPAARDRGQRANRRLHARWAAFDARLKLPVVANTAIARELAGWCWSLAVLDD